MALADSGQSRLRMMFDCGADTLHTASQAEIQSIAHLFLTHLHMDHVSGFDAFFRMNFARTNVENHIWGPAGTARILHHRFQGFWWSHAPELVGTWFVHDVDAGCVQTYRFEANEAFAEMHAQDERTHNGIVLQTPEVQVEAIDLVHHGLCLGYVVREAARQTVDMAAIAAMGMRPGPWLAALKKPETRSVQIDGVAHDAEALRTKVIQAAAGDSFAYLTDFLADETQCARIAPRLSGVQTLYAEAQYAVEDGELARKYYHSTVDQIAMLARDAGVERYTLLHLSRRYSPAQWIEMAAAARAIFPNSGYVAEWGLE
ncbi:MBL fold metallo-hydrolase [Sphingomonas sp. 22176]|uniref:MBL fold metallo-hydrolase n=1 Tax=Sphingomonas sp. 22176 TaxID=3453884 RepID=UPI003F875B73